MNDGYCGDCIFCFSKCPECGSEDIEVKVMLDGQGWEYFNDIQNIISIYRSDEIHFWFDADVAAEISITCEDCYYENDSLEFGSKHVDHESNLLNKLDEVIDSFEDIENVMEIKVTIDDDSKIDSSALKYDETYAVRKAFRVIGSWVGKDSDQEYLPDTIEMPVIDKLIKHT